MRREAGATGGPIIKAKEYKVYDINIFKEANVELTVADIYYGIRNNLIYTEQVVDAVLLCNNIDDVDGFFAEFFYMDSLDRCDIQELFECLYEKEIIDSDDVSVAKWQYCIVKHIMMIDDDFELQTLKIAEAYADLDYPHDMDGIVYYMPSDCLDDVNLSAKIKGFLEEKEKLLRKYIKSE